MAYSSIGRTFVWPHGHLDELVWSQAIQDKEHFSMATVPMQGPVTVNQAVEGKWIPSRRRTH